MPFEARPVWREARRSDLRVMEGIADVVHRGLRQRKVLFARKLALFPDGCFLLDIDGSVVGYAISHPWHVDKVPPADGPGRMLPADADCLFVYDVAILHRARGRAGTRLLLDCLAKVAQEQRLHAIALVANSHAVRLWENLGFRVVAADTRFTEGLASYGRGARYMRKWLDGPGNSAS
ncbi:MAG: GNAT family N-acetyltransferase [Acetobacteraceae bacterium]|nr:GNAT family N-acetyltransferase [Acetobacteraceae bacterium]